MYIQLAFFGKYRPIILQANSREDVIAFAHKAIKGCDPDYVRFVESSLASMYNKPSNYSAMSYTNYAFGSVSMSSNKYDPWLESLFLTMEPKPGIDYSMHNGKGE